MRRGPQLRPGRVGPVSSRTSLLRVLNWNLVQQLSGIELYTVLEYCSYARDVQSEFRQKLGDFPENGIHLSVVSTDYATCSDRLSVNLYSRFQYQSCPPVGFYPQTSWLHRLKISLNLLSCVYICSVLTSTGVCTLAQCNFETVCTLFDQYR